MIHTSVTDKRTDRRAIAYSALNIYAMLSRAKKSTDISKRVHNIGPTQYRQ